MFEQPVEQTHLTPEEMGDIIRSFGYTSAIVTLRADTTAEMLVDTMVGTRAYSKSVIAVNKIDIASEEEIVAAEKALPPRLANHANIRIQRNWIRRVEGLHLR